MDSILGIKPNMSVLGQGKMQLSPFGLLVQSFAEEIRSHAGSTPGFYMPYSLDYLEEGAEEEEGAMESAPPSLNLHVDLKLILQQMKERGEDQAAVRIVEKVVSSTITRERTAQQRRQERPRRNIRPAAPAPSGGGPRGPWPQSPNRSVPQASRSSYPGTYPGTYPVTSGRTDSAPARSAYENGPAGRVGQPLEPARPRPVFGTQGTPAQSRPGVSPAAMTGFPMHRAPSARVPQGQPLEPSARESRSIPALSAFPGAEMVYDQGQRADTDRPAGVSAGGAMQRPSGISALTGLLGKRSVDLWKAARIADQGRPSSSDRSQPQASSFGPSGSGSQAAASRMTSGQAPQGALGISGTTPRPVTGMPTASMSPASLRERIAPGIAPAGTVPGTPSSPGSGGTTIRPNAGMASAALTGIGAIPQERERAADLGEQSARSAAAPGVAGQPTPESPAGQPPFREGESPLSVRDMTTVSPMQTTVGGEAEERTGPLAAMRPDLLGGFPPVDLEHTQEPEAQAADHMGLPPVGSSTQILEQAAKTLGERVAREMTVLPGPATGQSGSPSRHAPGGSADLESGAEAAASPSGQASPASLRPAAEFPPSADSASVRSGQLQRREDHTAGKAEAAPRSFGDMTTVPPMQTLVREEMTESSPAGSGMDSGAADGTRLGSRPPVVAGQSPLEVMRPGMPGSFLPMDLEHVREAEETGGEQPVPPAGHTDTAVWERTAQALTGMLAGGRTARTEPEQQTTERETTASEPSAKPFGSGRTPGIAPDHMAGTQPDSTPIPERGEGSPASAGRIRTVSPIQTADRGEKMGLAGRQTPAGADLSRSESGSAATLQSPGAPVQAGLLGPFPPVELEHTQEAEASPQGEPRLSPTPASTPVLERIAESLEERLTRAPREAMPPAKGAEQSRRTEPSPAAAPQEQSESTASAPDRRAGQPVTTPTASDTRTGQPVSGSIRPAAAAAEVETRTETEVLPSDQVPSTEPERTASPGKTPAEFGRLAEPMTTVPPLQTADRGEKMGVTEPLPSPEIGTLPAGQMPTSGIAQGVQQPGFAAGFLPLELEHRQETEESLSGAGEVSSTPASTAAPVWEQVAKSLDGMIRQEAAAHPARKQPPKAPAGQQSPKAAQPSNRESVGSHPQRTIPEGRKQPPAAAPEERDVPVSQTQAEPSVQGSVSAHPQKTTSAGRRQPAPTGAEQQDVSTAQPQTGPEAQITAAPEMVSSGQTPPSAAARQAPGTVQPPARSSVRPDVSGSGGEAGFQPESQVAALTGEERSETAGQVSPFGTEGKAPSRTPGQMTVVPPLQTADRSDKMGVADVQTQGETSRVPAGMASGIGIPPQTGDQSFVGGFLPVELEHMQEQEAPTSGEPQGSIPSGAGSVMEQVARSLGERIAHETVARQEREQTQASAASAPSTRADQPSVSLRPSARPAAPDGKPSVEAVGRPRPYETEQTPDSGEQAGPAFSGGPTPSGRRGEPIRSAGGGISTIPPLQTADRSDKMGVADAQSQGEKGRAPAGIGSGVGIPPQTGDQSFVGGFLPVELEHMQEQEAPVSGEPQGSIPSGAGSVMEQVARSLGERIAREIGARPGRESSQESAGSAPGARAGQPSATGAERPSDAARPSSVSATADRRSSARPADNTRPAYEAEQAQTSGERTAPAFQSRTAPMGKETEPGRLSHGGIATVPPLQTADRGEKMGVADVRTPIETRRPMPGQTPASGALRMAGEAGFFGAMPPVDLEYIKDTQELEVPLAAETGSSTGPSAAQVLEQVAKSLDSAIAREAAAHAGTGKSAPPAKTDTKPAATLRTGETAGQSSTGRRASPQQTPAPSRGRGATEPGSAGTTGRSPGRGSVAEPFRPAQGGISTVPPLRTSALGDRMGISEPHRQADGESQAPAAGTRTALPSGPHASAVTGGFLPLELEHAQETEADRSEAGFPSSGQSGQQRSLERMIRDMGTAVAGQMAILSEAGQPKGPSSGPGRAGTAPAQTSGSLGNRTLPAAGPASPERTGDTAAGRAGQPASSGMVSTPRVQTGSPWTQTPVPLDLEFYGEGLGKQIEPDSSSLSQAISRGVESLSGQLKSMRPESAPRQGPGTEASGTRPSGSAPRPSAGQTSGPSQSRTSGTKGQTSSGSSGLSASMQRLLAMAAERWSVEEGGPLNPMTPPPVDLEYADLSGSEAGKTAGGAVSAPPAGTPNPSGSQARTGGASSGSGTGAAKAQKPSVSRTVKMGQVRQPTLVHRPMTSVRSGMQAGAAGSGATTFPEQQAAYPAVQMTYSSSVSSLARDLRQIVSMQSKTGAAAEAMAEKAAPESMQTINQMSQPLEQNQIVWQNPYMRGGPVSTDYRQKPAPARREQPQPQVRISEAEIRRTADRVFKMVQDKIVSERRRIGRY